MQPVGPTIGEHNLISPIFRESRDRKELCQIPVNKIEFQAKTSLKLGFSEAGLIHPPVQPTCHLHASGQLDSKRNGQPLSLHRFKVRRHTECVEVQDVIQIGASAGSEAKIARHGDRTVLGNTSAREGPDRSALEASFEEQPLKRRKHLPSHD